MNNKININPSSTKWLEKDDRVVADYFCDLGFRSLKQILDMRVFDLMNMQGLNAVRVEEVIICLYKWLNPNTATTCLGWRDNDGLTTTITDKLSGVIREDHTDPRSGILHHEENVDLLPANIELSAMEMMLVTAMSRETILRSYLSKVKDNYDYVLIDCMPSLGMVTLNALAAADSVIIPVQAQYLPAKGMTQLMQTIGKVRQYINPSLRIDGILLNIVDNRTNLAKSTADALRKNFGSVIKIYRSSIPMAVKAAEVASKGVSIYKYEPSSPVAKAYAEFAKEVSADGRKKERLHSADAR